ncbi:hypothetical protein DITRI_Ditri13aG0086000 [Diplodiscus trichospermus]
MFKEGSLYSINRFTLRKSKNCYNAIPGEFNICVTRATPIKEIHEDLTAYPKHYFNFIPFENLNHMIYQNKFLAGNLNNLLYI